MYPDLIPFLELESKQVCPLECCMCRGRVCERSIP